MSLSARHFGQSVRWVATTSAVASSVRPALYARRRSSGTWKLGVIDPPTFGDAPEPLEREADPRLHRTLRELEIECDPLEGLAAEVRALEDLRLLFGERVECAPDAHAVLFLLEVLRLVRLERHERGIVEIDRRAMLASQAVDDPVPSDREEPRRGARSRDVVPVCLAPHGEHDVLDEVVGLRRRDPATHHEALEPRRPLGEELAERVAVAVGGNRSEQVFRGTRHCRPSMP